MIGMVYFDNFVQSPMVLNLKQVLGNDTALTPDAGDIVFPHIFDAINAHQSIKLDFEGMRVMSSAFLNVAIGQLYSKFDSDDLNNYLKIQNLADEDKALLKKVIIRAKDYFKDQKSFEDRISDLYEDE